jgi:hypothetical protein
VIFRVLPIPVPKVLQVWLSFVDVAVWQGTFLPTVMPAAWLSVAGNRGVERMRAALADGYA